jgi:flavin reductase (DIM6/NTAB) family NADH-FMN oxidoreductase RutF
MAGDFDRFVGPLDPAALIVTAAVEGERSGCLVGFQAQCSIDPPLLAVWVSHANHTHGVAARATHLGVHVLGDDERELAELFGGTTGDEVDKFERCRWTPGAFDVPLLDDCPRRGVFEVVVRHDVGGDHDLFVLAPVDITTGSTGDTALRIGALDIEPGHPVPPE